MDPWGQMGEPSFAVPMGAFACQGPRPPPPPPVLRPPPLLPRPPPLLPRPSPRPRPLPYVRVALLGPAWFAGCACVALSEVRLMKPRLGFFTPALARATKSVIGLAVLVWIMMTWSWSA